jgi:hypothetical protein
VPEDLYALVEDVRREPRPAQDAERDEGDQEGRRGRQLQEEAWQREAHRVEPPRRRSRNASPGSPAGEPGIYLHKLV